MTGIPEMFGSMVFNDAVMKKRLPEDTYNALKKTMQDGKSLDVTVANVVANEMKDWAIEKGATHFTHWFQPMTGITAEKHDSFITPTNDGAIDMEFSGKELVKGEPDASSFPNGGLRATFEARGYTAWDPTSFAFVKDNTLCIPTAFCSYGGYALDKKTPLLRSMEAVSKQAKRIITLFGYDETVRVNTTVGAEQEYFLIDKEVFNKRKDLIFTGRTLFGAKPPKGQELDDHYFGALRPRVASFMSDLDEELWKLGIAAKTEHNEAAPAQHEMAPVYTTTNIATDHNQLTMEIMKKVADRHGLSCLLHEKPFAGVNGSGKHNNWSLSTSTGTNLLDPGKTPAENAQFLLFLCAVIKAVDDYQDLMRISVASAGNDHRLGANEAPPAIVSIYVGDEIEEILKSIESDTAYENREKSKLSIGVHVLPKIPQDTSDRNRTSPFAFTGNKFEFRMLGSSASIAEANVVINTAVAKSLDEFATELENAEDFTCELNILIKKIIKKHRRIIFNGNGYEASWVVEAEKRGLSNLKSSPMAISHYCDEKNLELFKRYKVLTDEEMFSRKEIMLENYAKMINIEALTMIDMANKEILPAAESYMKELADTCVAKKTAFKNVSCTFEERLLEKLSTGSDDLYEKIQALDQALLGVYEVETDMQACANYYHDVVFSAMQELRIVADEIESTTAKKYWPYPTYSDILFSV